MTNLKVKTNYDFTILRRKGLPSVSFRMYVLMKKKNGEILSSGLR